MTDDSCIPFHFIYAESSNSLNSGKSSNNSRPSSNTSNHFGEEEEEIVTIEEVLSPTTTMTPSSATTTTTKTVSGVIHLTSHVRQRRKHVLSLLLVVAKIVSHSSCLSDGFRHSHTDLLEWRFF